MKAERKTKIISGGQTGVDRAALDFAFDHGLACGGWCPKGRTAEDGPISSRYPLQETNTTAYPERTEINIRESDATFIIYRDSFDAGTNLTLHLCKKLAKPVVILRLSDTHNKKVIKDWIDINNIRVLNIAGPRESSSPGIYDETKSFLEKLFY